MSVLLLLDSASAQQFSILAPVSVRGGHPLVVSVSLLRAEGPGEVLVTATLSRGENSVSSVETELRMGDTRDLSVPVPEHLGGLHHSYSLELLGEELYRMDSKIFHEKIPLQPWEPGHVITAELPNIIRPGHQLWARISVRNSDLSLYQGPLTVSLLSPAGDLVTTEVLHIRGASLHDLSWDGARLSNSSSSTFRYQVDRRAPTGLWTVRLATERAEVRRTINVLDFRPGRMEVSVSLPATVSSTQTSLSGSVTANYSSTGLPVCGNLSLTAVTTDHNGTVLASQSLQEPEWTVINKRASSTFTSSVTRLDNVDQDQLRKHFYALNTDSSLHFMLVKSEGELKVKILARVGDLCTGDTVEGWSSVRVVEPSVSIRFVGPASKVIDRDLGFTTTVVAELERVDRLGSAVVSVETRLVLRNGSQVMVGEVEKLKEPGVGVAAWRHSSSLRSELYQVAVEVEEVRGLILTAHYSDSLITSSAQMFLKVGRQRPRLQLSTSTRHPEVGSNAVFHVRSNQEVRLLHYIVLSSGHVTDSGSLHLGTFNIRTFHLSLNSSLVPLATLLVWTTANNGNILAQYINIPVYDNLPPDPVRSPESVNDCSWYESLYSSINDVGLTIQRWEYEDLGCAGVSVWPESGEADLKSLTSLQVSLLSDQGGGQEEETVGECPPGLYWCKDTCYSHGVCHHSRLRAEVNSGDSNLRAIMFTQQQPSQGGLKVVITGPEECKVGEEISVEVLLEVEDRRNLVIKVARSHQYEVRQSEHKVSVRPGERRSVRLWVAVRSEGEVVLLLTVAGVRHLHTFLSRGPGVPQCDHTSIMMDLTHHNTWTQHHLNINNNSNNILTLSVTGDTLGPLVLDQLKPAVTCFDSVSRLSVLVSHYRYRRARQLRLEDGMLGDIRGAYQQLLSCKHPQGGFTVHFNTRTRSVWLTGMALRTLLASSELSPRVLRVEPSLLDTSLDWIISLQEPDGSFQEREMFPDPGQAPVELHTVSVTAEVVSSLSRVRGQSRVRSVLQSASQWLAGQLELIDRDPHPHHLAVVAHSLHLANSVSREAAFQLLSKYRVESGQFMFWGSDGEEEQQERTEISGQVRLLPNPVLCCQSLSVRATALALLTYTARRERLTLPIVTWLHARRGGHSTWSDGVSSALATEALVSFALDTEDVETSLAVRLDISETPESVKTFYLTLNSAEMSQQLVAGEAKGGVVTVTAQGRGRAVVQLSQQFSEADTRPAPVEAFSLDLRAGPGSVTACFSWLCPDKTGYSGPTVVSVRPPTGWSVISNMVGEGEVLNNTLYVSHNYLSPVTTCLTVPLYQQFPVSILDSSVLVRLESVLATEHFVQGTVRLPSPDRECRGCQHQSSEAGHSQLSYLVSLMISLYYC